MITVGVGARSGVSAEEVLAAVDSVLPADAGSIEPGDVASVLRGALRALGGGRG